jgi:hypothetical protein
VSNWWRPKASTTARGYGATHQADRKRWAPLVEAGMVACVRCGFAIFHGQRWHLDHADDGTRYLGPAHAKRNLRAAGKRGNELMREKQALDALPKRRSQQW